MQLGQKGTSRGTPTNNFLSEIQVIRERNYRFGLAKLSDLTSASYRICLGIPGTLYLIDARGGLGGDEELEFPSAAPAPVAAAGRHTLMTTGEISLLMARGRSATIWRTSLRGRDRPPSPMIRWAGCSR
jgi:hypothetical protein